MLTAMVVHLQAEAGRRFNYNTLDLETRTFFQHGICAPGAVHGGVQFVRFMALGFEAGVEVFHILSAAAVCNQNGIRGINDDEIADAYGADDTLPALNVTVADIMQHDLTFNAVTVHIGCGEIAQCVPRADVTPADSAGHHGDIPGFFHDGIVDGIIRNQAKSFRIELDLKKVFALCPAGLFETRAGGSENIRAVQLHLAQDGARRKAEHAGVPPVVAGFQILLRFFQAGLFDEAEDLVAFRFDIAVAGFWCLRLNAEGDQLALRGQLHGLRNGLRKSGLIGD